MKKSLLDAYKKQLVFLLNLCDEQLKKTEDETGKLYHMGMIDGLKSALEDFEVLLEIAEEGRRIRRENKAVKSKK